nr:DUF3047 domain-containing protein [Marinobacter sp. X15-166B]
MASPDDGWEPLVFPGIDQHSNYRLVTDAGVQVMEAQTRGGASGLIARLNLLPDDQLQLRWRWKVSGVYRQGDARRKAGDDYPARIYVAFAFEPDRAGWFDKFKRNTVRVLFGEELPGKALNYIWANKLPPGEFIANPYTDQTVMVAVNSGDARANQWVTVTRNLAADYRRAFGGEPPAIVGIGIMSDADNTGEAATAWYGDIVLLHPHR